MTRSRAATLLARALGAVSLVAACVDGSQSPPARPESPEIPEGGNLAPLDLVYVCGNKFLATNSTRSTVHLTWRVAGTGETGSVTLAPGPVEDPGFSETELETRERGVVELYRDGERVARRRNEGSPCGAAPVMAAAAASAADPGTWSPPFAWPMVAVHLSLLPDGRVLSWGLQGTPTLWDPASGTFTPVPSPAVLFCAGHSLLPDGRLLVSGGHIASDRGLPDINLFNAATGTWTSSAPMRRGRWYPTNTTMGSGAVVILAGRDQVGDEVAEPEVWTPGGIRVLTGASLVLPYYPRAFLAPDGRIFYAGELQTTRYLNTSGTGSWTTVGERRYGTRYYGAAVMYDDGKILYAGGGRTTNTAEIIDLNAASPSWQWTGSMAFARKNLNATVLPTGEVLVTGGSSGAAFNDIAEAVRAAEMWNPTTGVWTVMASSAVRRSYHATSILLPDGRVLHTGSGDNSEMPDELSAELFSPPYLSRWPRPTITDAPELVGYGTSFQVLTPHAADIDKVSLIRLGSVTHAFDQNQRYLRLPFTRETGALEVSAPTSANRAPPGHYMLFILDRSGVPSVAKIVKVGAVSEPPPPSNEAPAAVFLAGCSRFNCIFADRSTDPDGNLSSWSWDFGDGAQSSSRDPTHLYTQAGSYTVSLTVEDGEGASATATQQVSVPGPEFPIGLSASSRLEPDRAYVTLDWSRAQGSRVYLYMDGLVIQSTENDGRHTVGRPYRGPVSYLFKVCEAASAICSNEVTVQFGGGTPTNQPPTADFSSSCSGRTCNFTDRSSDADGSVSGWSWSFGDGGTSLNRNPSRTYAADGTYGVTLQVTDDDGAKNSHSASVTVSSTSSITLTATGREDATRQYMVLRWSGVSGARVDIYRNGTRVARTVNDGRQTVSRAFTGPATYVMKVCQEGSTICSNEVALVFD